MRKINITGEKFNKWTAIYEVENGKNSKWLFQCDCGNYKIVNKMSVMHGKSKSCGCLQKLLNRQRYMTPIEQTYKEIENKGYIFIEWIDGYNGAKSKVKLKNKKDEVFITSIDVLRRNIGENKQLHDGRLRCFGEDVYNDFIKKDLIPMFKPEEYSGYNMPLPFICKKHQAKGIQYKTYNILRVSEGCKYCGYEKIHEYRPYKNIYKFLRNGAYKWRKESFLLCNGRCLITNTKIQDIHHLFGFTKIIKEVFEITDIDIHEDLEEYTQDELIKLISTCEKIHVKYGFGIGLCKSIHKLFHSQYGKENSTHEQFKEFINRLESHEFDTYLKENNLSLNINYDILDKLLK